MRFIFLLGFVVAQIHSVSAFVPDKLSPSCRELLVRANRSIVDLDDASTGENSEAFYDLKLSGDLADLHPWWQYEFKSSGEANPPALKVFFKTRAFGPSDLELHFHRQEDGSFRDINILEAALRHLYDNARSGDSFSLRIDDRRVLDVIQDRMLSMLSSLKYRSEMPEVKADDFSGIRWKAHDEAALSEILGVLENDFGLLSELGAPVGETPFGHAVKASQRPWNIRIQYDLTYAKDEEFNDITHGLQVFRLILIKP